MLKIYSKKDLLPKPVVESHNEVFFRRNMTFNSLTETDFTIIKNIDKAKRHETENGFFISPFGIAQIKHFSTGCKSVLNAVHHPDKIFSFAECGRNAISELARVCEQLGLDVSIYLPRYREIEPFVAPVMFNNTVINTDDEFYDAWHGGELDE